MEVTEVTTKQVVLLERLNLLVPPDKWAASCLLAFVLRGNEICDENAKGRRALARKFWKDWVDELVKIIHFGHRFQGVCGRVEYLRARTKQELRRIIATSAVRTPLPFVAVVRLDSVAVKILVEIHLTGLSRQVGERQMRLFPS